MMGEFEEIAHEGRAVYRLAENPMERRFHDAWKAKQTGDTLALMLGDGVRKGEPTARDAMVAATVIQWLGCPVGTQFLQQVRYGAGGQGMSNPRDTRFPAKNAAFWKRECARLLDENEKLRTAIENALKFGGSWEDYLLDAISETKQEDDK